MYILLAKSERNYHDYYITQELAICSHAHYRPNKYLFAIAETIDGYEKLLIMIEGYRERSQFVTLTATNDVNMASAAVWRSAANPPTPVHNRASNQN